jgi:hypothetical protein
MNFDIRPSVCRGCSSAKESFDILYGNGRAVTCRDADQLGAVIATLVKAHVEERS